MFELLRETTLEEPSFSVDCVKEYVISYNASDDIKRPGTRMGYLSVYAGIGSSIEFDCLPPERRIRGRDVTTLEFAGSYTKLRRRWIK